MRNPEKYNQIRKSMDRSFTPDYPYSKLLVELLNFAGPIAETEWVEEDGVLKEKVIRNLTKSEEFEFVGNLQKNIYNKANSFSSPLIKVKVISEGLF